MEVTKALEFLTSQERGAMFERRFEEAVQTAGGCFVRMPEGVGFDYVASVPGMFDGALYPVECKAIDNNLIRLRHFTRRELVVAEHLHRYGLEQSYLIAYPYYGGISITTWTAIRPELVVKRKAVNLNKFCKHLIT